MFELKLCNLTTRLLRDIIALVCVIGLYGLQGGAVAADSELLIDTYHHTMQVLHHGKVIKTYHNLALGRGGVGDLRYRGDGKTPTGTYRIAWINPNSRFHLFFGLDYPSLDQAETALTHGTIDLDTYAAIRDALDNGQVPPQDTPLGGFIGIHGIGSGNLDFHKKADWTQGCVALTNEQIEELANYVELGTRVVIY